MANTYGNAYMKAGSAIQSMGAGVTTNAQAFDYSTINPGFSLGVWNNKQIVTATPDQIKHFLDEKNLDVTTGHRPDRVRFWLTDAGKDCKVAEEIAPTSWQKTISGLAKDMAAHAFWSITPGYVLYRSPETVSFQPRIGYLYAFYQGDLEIGGKVIGVPAFKDVHDLGEIVKTPMGWKASRVLSIPNPEPAFDVVKTWEKKDQDAYYYAFHAVRRYVMLYRMLFENVCFELKIFDNSWPYVRLMLQDWSKVEGNPELNKELKSAHIKGAETRRAINAELKEHPEIAEAVAKGGFKLLKRDGLADDAKKVYYTEADVAAVRVGEFYRIFASRNAVVPMGGGKGYWPAEAAEQAKILARVMAVDGVAILFGYS